MAPLDHKPSISPAAESGTLPALDLIGDGNTRLLIVYRNWRGEVAERTIIPHRFWFGSTKWHPEPQWLLDAEDLSKGAMRSFSAKDFLKVTLVDD